MKILLVNGPPKSGKDTVGDFFIGRKVVLVTKFAKALKEMTHALFGAQKRHDAYEDCKDDPHPDFRGISPRQAYIAVSEKLMKPLFGKTIFGDIILREILDKGPGFVVITDSGFRHEAFPLIDEFGHDNIVMIRLSRKGRTYAGDSRRRFRLPGIKTFDIKNDGTFEQLELNVVDVLEKTGIVSKI